MHTCKQARDALTWQPRRRGVRPTSASPVWGLSRCVHAAAAPQACSVPVVSVVWPAHPANDVTCTWRLVSDTHLCKRHGTHAVLDVVAEISKDLLCNKLGSHSVHTIALDCHRCENAGRLPLRAANAQTNTEYQLKQHESTSSRSESGPPGRVTVRVCGRHAPMRRVRRRTRASLKHVTHTSHKHVTQTRAAYINTLRTHLSDS